MKDRGLLMLALGGLLATVYFLSKRRPTPPSYEESPPISEEEINELGLAMKMGKKYWRCKWDYEHNVYIIQYYDRKTGRWKTRRVTKRQAERAARIAGQIWRALESVGKKLWELVFGEKSEEELEREACEGKKIAGEDANRLASYWINMQIDSDIVFNAIGFVKKGGHRVCRVDRTIYVDGTPLSRAIIGSSEYITSTFRLPRLTVASKNA
ncbi:MAG: hypothetical protein DRO01_02915 [Thermoproteota archaeon]|nr:MAG: hypothetical protein DRO01_02915 [Candidatus Korarchaeota archaeon]